MPIKTILVSLNVINRAAAVLDVACSLAARHDAHLIGLYVIPGIQIYAVPGAYPAVELNEWQRTRYKENVDAMREQFEAAANKHNVKSEWRHVQSENHLIAATVVQHAMQTDLIVASQVDPNGEDAIDEDFAERIVMEAGRPLLIVPHKGSFPSVGSNAVVGWNATREAARAISDATTLLAATEKTTLVWVDAQLESAKSGDLPGAEMAAALARHGVKVDVQTLPTAGKAAGEVLLDKVEDLGADLLVIGAYGHSRMREFIFGGVTRRLLDDMTVPVLMSH